MCAAKRDAIKIGNALVWHKKESVKGNLDKVASILAKKKKIHVSFSAPKNIAMQITRGSIVCCNLLVEL